MLLIFWGLIFALPTYFPLVIAYLLGAVYKESGRSEGTEQPSYLSRLRDGNRFAARTEEAECLMPSK